MNRLPAAAALHVTKERTWGSQFATSLRTSELMFAHPAQAVRGPFSVSENQPRDNERSHVRSDVRESNPSPLS